MYPHTRSPRHTPQHRRMSTVRSDKENDVRQFRRASTQVHAIEKKCQRKDENDIKSRHSRCYSTSTTRPMSCLHKILASLSLPQNIDPTNNCCKRLHRLCESHNCALSRCHIKAGHDQQWPSQYRRRLGDIH